MRITKRDMKFGSLMDEHWVESIFGDYSRSAA